MRRVYLLLLVALLVVNGNLAVAQGGGMAALRTQLRAAATQARSFLRTNAKLSALQKTIVAASAVALISSSTAIADKDGFAAQVSLGGGVSEWDNASDPHLLIDGSIGYYEASASAYLQAAFAQHGDSSAQLAEIHFRLFDIHPFGKWLNIPILGFDYYDRRAYLSRWCRVEAHPPYWHGNTGAWYQLRPGRIATSC